MKDIRDVSNKLDFTLQISLSVAQEMGMLFGKNDESIPLSASLSNDSGRISLYLDAHQKGKFEPALGRLDHVSKGSYDIYELEAEELVSEIRFFGELVQIPSVVPGGLYFRSGNVFADFRFHHSALGKVSSLIRKISEARNRIKLAHLGKSKGLVGTLREINSRIPLSAISFSYEPEDDYASPEEILASPVIEAKLFAVGMESDFDIVYYAPRMSGPGRVIDAESGIFESTFRTDCIKTLIRDTKQARVPVASLVGEFRSGRVENVIFLPSFLSEDLLNLLFTSSDSVDCRNLQLEGYSPFSSYLQETDKAGN